MKAEVLWTLNTIAKHQSYNGNEGISELFKSMFPDSDIATTFTCGSDKTAYIAKFGLAVHIKEELVSKVNKSPFVLMFDESLNETTKNKQLDVHVRFWDEGQVQSRYLGSQFMGHSTAQDLLSHLKECMDKLDLRHLVSISMDGPSVNWKLFDIFQKDQSEQYGENLPVVERALAVWPSLLLYMEAVKTKRLSNPGTASYDTVAAAIKDPLILAKLQFYAALARTFTPFLKKYQTDNPVLPFLPKDFTELMMSLLRRFIKREVLHDITALQLTKLDVTDKTIWLSPQDISIGLGAESVLKSIKGAELRVLEFKRECMQGLCNIIRKVQDKSPLKYLTVRQLVCLDPSVMYREPERCRNHMKGLVQRFLQDKQLTDTSAGDVILQQFDSLLSLESRSEDFLSFPPMQKRLDVFLCSAMEPYPELWAFCKKLLILSHGQATVERGFSINKEVESDNLKEDTVVTRRLVCDYTLGPADCSVFGTPRITRRGGGLALVYRDAFSCRLLDTNAFNSFELQMCKTQ
ncbi:uncharacterized protein LOC114458643 [Gouania willdenowi]|uniref:uncharacterized protein LOC114458643 n=1 Tax=Gouania willdenowi TaxID=441366 RepID=UPI001056D1C8|nr:uncharacterized protein LOC114458643 [Gouania willdenowi]